MMAQKWPISAVLLIIFMSCSQTVESLSCHQCQGQECQTTTSLTDCDESCFILFDDMLSVGRFGCTSELDGDDEVIRLIKEKRLIKCSEDDCNFFSLISNPIDCLSCDSQNIENCATYPSRITTKIKSRIPYTQCYERVEKNGHTLRGALSDLPAESFYGCLIGSVDNDEDTLFCNICEGPNCNSRIIPTDRPRCHRCTSEIANDCENAPQAHLSPCPVYSDDQDCMSLYTNEVLYRGCHMEYDCPAGNRNCENCTGNGCNTVDIRKQVESGIFQTLPLKCFECSGIENCSSENKKSTECQEFDDCITVFNTEGQVQQRGCEANVLLESQVYCNENANMCFTCKSNNCNTAQRNEYKECLFCDSTINSNCQNNPEDIKSRRQCAEGCVTTWFLQKPLSKFKLIRSCFEDMEVNDRNNCEADPNCKQCDNAVCNDNLLEFEERLKCYHCEGLDCDPAVIESQYCAEFKSEDQCFIYYDKDTSRPSRRGCISELKNNELINEFKQYYLCDGTECNRDEPQPTQCLVCSSESSNECTVLPSAIETDNTCVGAHTQCYTQFTEEGGVKRGCLNSLTSDEVQNCLNNNKNCKVCSDNNCNNQIMPEDRLSCYECADAACTTSKLNYCIKYDPNDYCFAKKENGLIDLMGCASSQTAEDLEKWKDSLLKCKDNVCDLEELGAMECYACDSNKSINCIQFPTLNNKNKCKANTKCVVYLDSGNHTIRDCHSNMDSSVSDTCIEQGRCQTCAGSGCNYMYFPMDRRECHICNSLNSDTCAKEPNSLKMCSIYIPNDGCVSKRDGEFIERNCASSLDCDTNDTNNCQKCNDNDGCNTHVFNAAPQVLQSSALLLMILLFVGVSGS